MLGATVAAAGGPSELSLLGSLANGLIVGTAGGVGRGGGGRDGRALAAVAAFPSVADGRVLEEVGVLIVERKHKN